MPRSMFVKDHMKTEVVTLRPDMEILQHHGCSLNTIFPVRLSLISMGAWLAC